MARSSPVDDDYVGDTGDMLSRICDDVLDETAKLGLLKSLNKRGLCTREVLSFAKNQADLRSSIKTLDMGTTRNAMRSKIRDSMETLRRLHIAKAHSIRRYLEENDNKKYKLRKTLKSIKHKQENTNRKRALKYEKKIKHLDKVMEDMKQKYGSGKVKSIQMCPSRVPERLKDYNELCIFRTSKDLPQKQEILGPYLCHPEIILSPGEHKLLSHSPKFSLMQQIDRVEFDTEIEKGLCKHRFNEHNINLQNRRKLDMVCPTVCISADQQRGKMGQGEAASNSDDELLKKIWDSEAHRYVYNPFCKEIDFSRRRPTDYKLNTRINLPKPLPTDDEFQCETRKRQYRDAFDEFTQTKEKVGVNGTMDTSTSKESLAPNKGGKRKFMNLSKTEREGMISLKKRIKDNDIMIIPTDKSGRFSVMTHKQYLDAGRVHTDKDIPIGWDDVRYLKNQTNSHMWWLTKIWSYSKHTDPERMLNNLTVSGLDLPEMSLLTKDHKSWSWDSNKPVPTRPVMSGNCCINTHLSELISEVVEPLVLEYDGAEVQSSEEVLALLDNINEHVAVEGKPPNTNYLEKFQYFNKTQDPVGCSSNDLELRTERGKTSQQDCTRGPTDKQHFNFSEITGAEKQRELTGVKSPHEDISPHEHFQDHSDDDTSIHSQSLNQEILLNVSDQETVDTLTELGVQAIEERRKGANLVTCDESKPSTKKLIVDYFQKLTSTSGNNVDTVEWLQNLVGTSRNKYNSNQGTLNERLVDGIRAGDYWGRAQSIRSERVQRSSECVKQDSDLQPILFGCDVVGLYPNLDPISVAHVTAQSAMNTNVKFSSVNYYFLIIYLVLVLGKSQMERIGLGQCIAKKKKMNNINSLAAQSNREVDSWDFTGIKLDDHLKKKMIAICLQLMVLLLTSTTCYKFGGRLFRQKSGLGIGLRGSAALARLVMCTWDCTWGYMQFKLGLMVQLFCRYVDDIRLYLRPIMKGYKWSDNGWCFTEDEDDRTPSQRTIEELNKSLNDTWSFLEFTTEGEADFNDLFLPTLDFATRVDNNGYVKYKFYNKPMTSNLILENGTALSSGCVFSSLRQDLVRRLYNSDLSMGIQFRIGLVNDYIQLLVNSGHKFSYIKSIVLQALTKYEYMVSRSKLPKKDIKYMPLHRDRNFDTGRRKLIKYSARAVWYTRTDVKDKFRNTWKSWIRRKGQTRGKMIRYMAGRVHGDDNSAIATVGSNKRITRSILQNDNRVTTAMFIPKTRSGQLAKSIQDLENGALYKQSNWTVKVLEKPGVQLAKIFVKSFEMMDGCWRDKGCMCGNKGSACTTKGVVYEATCVSCNETKPDSATYIGETARQIGTRVAEHLNNVRLFKKQSFILDHWMTSHGMDPQPPTFEFKVLSKHKDALTRQIREAILIRNRGNLNKRDEFALNEIIKMESSRYIWDELQTGKANRQEEEMKDKCFKNFVEVMKNVKNAPACDKLNIVNYQNNVNLFYRLLKHKRDSDIPGQHSDCPAKRRRGMDTSTPCRYREQEPVIQSPPDSSPIAPDERGFLPVEDGSQNNDSGGVTRNAHTNISTEASNLAIETEMAPISTVEALAMQVVAADDMRQGEINFCDRVGAMTQEDLASLDWDEVPKFKASENDSKSFDVVDLLKYDEDFGLDLLFRQHGHGQEESIQKSPVDLEDYGLLWLFKDHVEECTDPDDYGLQWLFTVNIDYFGEEDINESQLGALIDSKKKNKLYSIFLQENKLPSTPKRKHSPEEAVSNKLRRMTLNSVAEASPVLRGRETGSKARGNSLSRSVTRRKSNRSNSLDPRQMLITRMLGERK